MTTPEMEVTTLNQATDTLLATMQSEDSDSTEDLQDEDSVQEEDTEEQAESEEEDTDSLEEEEVSDGVSIEFDDNTLDLTDEEVRTIYDISTELKESGLSLTEIKAERLRNKDYTQGKQKLAEDRRTMLEQHNTQLQQVQERLNFAEQSLIGDVQEFQGVNWEQLKASDEFEYNDKMGRYLQVQQKANTLLQQMEANRNEQATAQTGLLQQKAEEEFGLAKIELPELATQEGATAFAKDVVTYMESVGYSQEEMSILDHRQFKILKDAMAGKKFRETGKTLAGKKVRKAPRVVRKAGVPKTRSQKVSKAQKAQSERVSSGKIVDATELLLKHFQ